MRSLLLSSTRSIAALFASIVYIPLCLAVPAFEDQGFVLTSSGNFTQGLGAPTVAYDEANSQYVMYFEAQGTATSSCASYYEIGRATSPDGISWTLDAAPVLVPETADTTSSYACSVAQPAVVLENGVWHLFVGMGGAKASSSATVNQATGIGHFTSTDGISFTEESVPAIRPAGTVAPSMPSVISYEGELYLVWIEYPDIKMAVRDAAGLWYANGDAVLSPGNAGDWTETWVFSPALLCQSGEDDFPFGMYFGADDPDSGRGFGAGVSMDMVEWWVSAENPLESATLDLPSLKHVDVLAAGEETLMWYSADDPATGLKAIGLATTSTSWDTPENKVCNAPVGGGDTGDTGSDTGVDTSTDSSTDTGSDTGTGGDCSHSRAFPALTLSLLGLALSFKRRLQ
jgi:hypothetical protein